MTYGLDDVDRAILYRLTRDARNTSATEIAEDVRVSAQTVRNRIDELEQAGVIQGYHARVDFERAAGHLTNLFMCSASPTERGTLARQALRIPGVVTVRELMTGRTDLRITAVASDTDGISRIARAITDLGIEIQSEDLVRREHVSGYGPYSPGAEERGPRITDFLNLAGEAEVVEFVAGDGAPIAGRTLGGSTVPGVVGEDALVVSIEREGDELPPREGMDIQPGDTVTLLAREGVDGDVERAFAGD